MVGEGINSVVISNYTEIPVFDIFNIFFVKNHSQTEPRENHI